MGWTTPWPTSTTEFNPALVNARVELRFLNFGIGSSPFSALNVCFETALPMIMALRDRLGAHGLCLDFAGELTPRLPEQYTFNGVENIERPLLNAELGLDLDVRQGKLRVGKNCLNARAVDIDGWDDGQFERHVGDDFVAAEALLSLGVDGVEDSHSWLVSALHVARHWKPAFYLQDLWPRHS
ncbi:hypothetical protein A1Q1_02020 [Trichosporon asahii var. asahii CBS 2479]|uniref:Uncharacterized protein n=1 Tax=Trichosporon asahii var. asahii (strain ATCC 90039 / CBS 2479 / JCM 2466 / KCTC 7840 / NBRC 103889/ NCYC 2677 / UAMH 7654) TaxID=1186058 RepID=J4UCY5_TRIAS|nr:hypothetical protein A1Q1_02020 [Trichosporon asahii var. asahii CBS 2479]EJT48925.1 hypothetical protein A1Q1_02020 [Trichosporon asahii var. asahii CBS 2479]